MGRAKTHRSGAGGWLGKSIIQSSHQFGVIHWKEMPAFEPRMGAEVSLPVMLDSFSDFAMEDPVGCVPFQWDYLESVNPFHAAGERKINVRGRCGAHHDPCKEQCNQSRYRSAKPKTRSKRLNAGP